MDMMLPGLLSVVVTVVDTSEKDIYYCTTWGKKGVKHSTANNREDTIATELPLLGLGWL